MKKSIIIFTAIFFFSSAQSQDSAAHPFSHLNETWLKEFPVLFQQTAAEYRALCYQAFNIAKLRINEIPAENFKKEKLAIITDLDETILDNSYVYGKLIKENKDYSDAEWIDWTNGSAATGVPGAVVFLQWAHQKGLTIFYISNRDTSEVSTTLINLQKLHLPNADTSHMLFLSNTSSKEVRRQIVMAEDNVVMLLGDNLNDFMQMFEKKPIDSRKEAVDNEKEEWGKKFIVLPNAMYGEWENALYNFHYDLNEAQKEAIRRQLLKGY
jgi:5'-nucleotidase (lipoprotein e(P4) family)